MSPGPTLAAVLPGRACMRPQQQPPSHCTFAGSTDAQCATWDAQQRQRRLDGGGHISWSTEEWWAEQLQAHGGGACIECQEQQHQQQQ